MQLCESLDHSSHHAIEILKKFTRNCVIPIAHIRASSLAGLITVGNDISQLFVSIVLSYYAGRGHRPRWIAFGIYTVSFTARVYDILEYRDLCDRCGAYYSHNIRATLRSSRIGKRRNQLSAHAPRSRAGRRHTSPIGRFLIKLGSVGIVATLIHASYHRALVVVCLAKRSIL